MRQRIDREDDDYGAGRADQHRHARCAPSTARSPTADRLPGIDAALAANGALFGRAEIILGEELVLCVDAVTLACCRSHLLSAPLGSRRWNSLPRKRPKAKWGDTRPPTACARIEIAASSFAQPTAGVSLGRAYAWGVTWS